jgi:hypothetical protein
MKAYLHISKKNFLWFDFRWLLQAIRQNNVYDFFKNARMGKNAWMSNEMARAIVRTSCEETVRYPQ